MRLAKAIACNILLDSIVKGGKYRKDNGGQGQLPLINGSHESWREQPRVPEGDPDGGQWTRSPAQGIASYWGGKDEEDRNRAFDRWYQPMQQEMERRARKLIHDEELAEDLVMDTICSALDAMTTRFDPLQGMKEGEDAEAVSARNFRSWMFAIFENKRKDQIRVAGRRPDISSLDLSLPGEEGDSGTVADMIAAPQTVDPLHQVLAKLDRDAISEAFSGLNEPFRSTAIDYYVHDVPAPEIAEKRGISPATVRTRLNRAKEHLRRKLRRQFPEVLAMRDSAQGKRSQGGGS